MAVSLRARAVASEWRRSLGQRSPQVGLRRVLLACAVLLPVSWPVGAAGQGARGGPASPSSARPAPAPGPEQDDSDQSESAVTEVVVAARRAPVGAVVGEIKPELVITPADIRSYGVSSVTELLAELAPQTGSGRGRLRGGAPAVLLNGRRISSFNEIRDLPTEAILRVDILPEEVALKYGFTADQRVVNIVLRRFFRANTAEASTGAGTEGGLLNGSAELNQIRIQRDDRLTFNARYQTSSGLTEAERDLTSASSSLFDRRGNVTATVAGGEIDPALSSLLGRPVTLAGVPATAAMGAPTLADFAATAGTANVSDTGAYRSLVPATDALTFNAVLARPLPAGIAATLNATLGATRSDSIRGLPGVSLRVPGGSSFSPFGSDVVVNRLMDVYGPLRQDTEGRTAHLGSTLRRDFGERRLTLTTTYDHADSATVGDVGLGPSALQTAVTSGAANPFGPLFPSLLPFRPEDKARSQSDLANVTFLATGSVAKLPAGPVHTSLTLSDAQDWFSSTSRRSGIEQFADLSRNELKGQLSLDLPIASRRTGFLHQVGELSANLNVAADELSDFGLLTTLGYGLNWTPVVGLSILASTTHDETAPTVQQLGDPSVLTTGARVFDFIVGRTADVTRVDGGNAALLADSRDVSKLGLNWKPIPGQELTLTANYVRSRIVNPIRSFPAATAAIQDVFPSRFVRNALGELVQIDLRPVNFSQENRDELRWGFNYSRPIGPPPPQNAARARRREDGAGGQRGGGAAGRGGAPGGGGRGFGPPGGFGGGGGFGGQGSQGRLQLALYHTVFLTDELLLRPGVPLLDRLNGAAAGESGGQPRHLVEGQAGLFRHGFGARVSANWQSATTLSSGGATGDLAFSDLLTLDLRLFIDFSARREWVQRWTWLRGSRVTLSINNLFDERIRVRDATGATPATYQPAFLDPQGRVVRLGFRKLFFTPPTGAFRRPRRDGT